jgi:hypothetical protein
MCANNLRRQRGSKLKDIRYAWVFRYRKYFIDEYGKISSRRLNKTFYKSDYPTERLAQQAADKIIQAVNKANALLKKSRKNSSAAESPDTTGETEGLAPGGQVEPMEIPEGEWRTCQRVALRSGSLYCELDPKGAYSLREAYARRPHILFAKAETDEQLIDFIRAWGPLYLEERMLSPGGVIANSAFKSGKREREALIRLIQVEDDLHEGRQALKMIAGKLHISDDPLDWAKMTNSQGVLEAMDRVVRDCIPVSCTLRLRYRPGPSGRSVEATWNLLSLEDALWWMIWYDEFTKGPRRRP